MKLIAVGSVACFSASCSTVYDSQGRPQQVVTPEGAALGAVAAGLIGYALNDGDRHRHRGYYRGHKYHRSHSYHRGYPRYGGYCY